MALKMLLMFLVSFCLAVTGQENERKNIKMLFVPAHVMKALRNNLTTKDLPAGLPGQGTQRWTPVRLPGDRTHTFEIRINPRTANKLNMNFQQFNIGRGHGLLLELKNVSLSTKGKTVLDKLVEFYKNCGSGTNPRISTPMMHRVSRLHPMSHHSLLLPGDVPLLRRIQSALERFFPKRHDGSVDVFQHKDSSGAVHFLPFEEVSKEVNNLIKRTLVKRDCVKISTDALTRALDAFRRKYDNDTTTSSENESVDANNDVDSENDDENNDDSEKDQVLSFSRNLDSVNPHPIDKANLTLSSEMSLPINKASVTSSSNVLLKKANLTSSSDANASFNDGNLTSSSATNAPLKKASLTSSSAMNVPSDVAATKIVSALADLRKEITDLSSNLKKKVSTTIPKDTDTDISVGTDSETDGSNVKAIKKMSSDNNDTNDENFGSFDLSEVKNRRKKMSSDDGLKVDNSNNKNNSNNNGFALALKLKNIEQDLKTELEKDLLKQKKKVSKIAGDSTSVNKTTGNDEHNHVKITNARPVNQAFNQVVNHLQRVKAAKEVKEIFSDETKKINKQARFKGKRVKTRHRNKHIGRLKDKKHRKRPSIVFRYKPKSLRLKLRHKGEEYMKADDEDDAEKNYHKHKAKGRLSQYTHMRRRHPKIKEVVLPDEEESEGYRQRNFDDSAEEDGESEDNTKVRLLKKLNWLRHHGPFPKVRSRKSPKLRVVVYDDDEEEKQPHTDSWRSNESDELTEKVEKVHEDDSEADTESEMQSESESETEPEPSAHHSEPFIMDDENNEQYNQRKTSYFSSNSDSNSDTTYENTEQYSQGEKNNPNSDSESNFDMQNLSDSIGDDSTHVGRSDGGRDVPDLEPYLKKNYESEENEENEEISMYNEQDGIDARKLGESMDKSKTPKQDDSERQPGRIHIHKIPFKIQEDSDGVDTSLLKEQPHNALGMQQVLSRETDIQPMASPDMSSLPAPEMTSMAPQLVQPVPFSPPNQNAIDMSPNMVMPPEQSTLIPAAAQLPQADGDAQMARPNVAAYTGVSIQPGMTQGNVMMPQTPFPQVSSMMPMQAGAAGVSPMAPVMQPGQIRTVIARGEGMEHKSRRSKKHARVSGKGNKRVKLARKKSRHL